MTRVKADRIRAFGELILFNNETKLGFTIVSAIVLTAIVIGATGTALLPYDPIQQNVGPDLAGPSLAHLFGTDYLGRDVLSRIAFATPNDVFVSFVVVGISFMIGAILGGVAAYRGGLLDEFLMRSTDIMFAIPGLVLAMTIALILGPSVINMMYALLVINWPPYARLARGEALRVTQYNFIAAARASGISTLGIWRKHILANILSTMVAYATVDIGNVAIVYAGLSYLGLSVRPPMPDWGAMVSAYQDYIISAPWLPLFPAIVIAIVVIAFGLLGDGVRDAVESRRIS